MAPFGAIQTGLEARAEAHIKRLLVLCLVPPAVIEEWSKTASETRGPAEAKMRTDWDAWMQEHAATVSGTEVGGKTKRVSSDGSSDRRDSA